MSVCVCVVQGRCVCVYIGCIHAKCNAMCIVPLSTHTLSHRSIPAQCTPSIHPLNTPPQYTPSMHPSIPPPPLTTGSTIHLMQQDTYDQFEVHQDMWGDAAKFIVDELVVDVQFYEGQPVSGKCVGLGVGGGK